MSGQEHYPTKPLLEPLTRRERDVLYLLAQGLSGPEIAEKLTLAVSSVKWHSKHLYAKLEVNSKKQAIARAHELGLLGAPPGAPVSGSPQTAPSPATEPESRHNLPLQVTRFFGREGEVAQLIELLGENRLVTLTGSGGVGKTRLSLRTAEEVLADFSDGVWIVELAPLADPAQVAPQIATTLGVRDEPGRPILDTLTNRLRERQFLLVLDNCEHLLAVCAQVADSLLRACPRLRLLATSREPLGVPGEALFPVPSLPYPDSGIAVTVEKVREYAAVRLFLDRARLVTPDYQLGSHNVAAVAQICQRLDGIPLALEMAAARINILSSDQLARRLQDVFQVLTGGSRTALPRQQTLRATIDWSYNLLSEPERVLLQCLAVFAGGCTLEAAEAVCSGGEPAAGQAILPEELIEVLASLVAKSMVVADRQAGEAARYHLLETIRQYALAKLSARGEAEAVRRRHSEYYLELASSSRRGPVFTFQSWLHQMEPEHDNLRAAFGWSHSTPSQIELSIRLANALLAFWDGRGYFAYLGEARAAFETMLARPDIANYPGEKAQALLLVGKTLFMQGDVRAAEAPLAESLALYQELGDRGNTANILFHLGQFARERGDADTARAWLEQALVIVQELGDQQGICNVMGTMGEAVILQGKLAEAKAMEQESLALARQLGDSQGAGWALNQLGHVAQLEGDYEEAVRLHQASLPIFEQLGPAEAGYVHAHYDLGETALAQSDAQTAADHFTDALAVAEDLGDRQAIAWCLAGLAGVAVLGKEPERAAWLWGAAETLRQRLGFREGPCAHDTHERLKAQAREWLGHAAFTTAWGNGEAAALTDAIQRASRVDMASTDRALHSRHGGIV